MNDREVALRFAAFWLRGVEGYAEQPAMDTFLETTTEWLDDEKRVPDIDLQGMYVAFRSAMSNAQLVFGEHAFRKWPLRTAYRSPVNRALVETWSIALALKDPEDLKRRKEAIVAAARQRMTTDYRYLEAITSSTGDRQKVRYRFDAARQDADAS
jgi:hypothetical protein